MPATMYSSAMAETWKLENAGLDHCLFQAFSRRMARRRVRRRDSVPPLSSATCCSGSEASQRRMSRFGIHRPLPSRRVSATTRSTEGSCPLIGSPKVIFGPRLDLPQRARG